MEPQPVFVCSTDVAAFVDALETICYPVVDAQNSSELSEATVQESLPHEETYTIENLEIIEPHEIRPPVKRYRTNPKEQKEIIEQLFENQKACVTEKSFMNIKGNKRFKSDVWSCFGDIKLLISRSEAKKLKIPYYSRQCGNEEILLSKSFVGCFKCSTLFIHDTQRSGTSTLRSHMRVCCRPRLKKKKGAPTVIFFKNKSKSNQAIGEVTDEQQQVVRNQILKYLLSIQRPFSTIEDPEFHKLLQMCVAIGATYPDVNIESMLCPPANLTDYMLNDMYVKSVNSFYTEFQYSYGATFCVNVWVEMHQKIDYISVVCYYANTKGELKSIIMHTDEFSCDTKTPEDVKDWFLTYIASIPVIPFKRLVVTDSQSNMVAALKDEQFVRCSYQAINTLLQEVVTKATATSSSEYPDFASLLNICKELVLYFKQIESQYPLPEPPKQCRDDKWNSIVSLFKSINKNYDDILNILNETNENQLLSFDKALISAVCDLFEIFIKAQNELSSRTEATLSIVIPWISKLNKHCMCASGDFAVVQQLKNLLLVEIDEHLTKNIGVYHRVATLLDPRFKRLALRPQDNQVNANLKTKCLVKECMEAPTVEDFPELHRATEVGIDHSSETFASHVPYDSGNSEKSAGKEVDAYFNENFQIANQDLEQQNRFNPLKYWAHNSDKYPNLRKIAMWVLSCPACSIDTRDPFLSNNWLVNYSRTHQKPESVSKYLFVKSFRRI